MGKSESGPDMQDCAVMWCEMQRLHLCTTTVLLELAGYAGGSHVRIHILSVSISTMTWDPEWAVASTLIWPNRENKTFEGAMFRALAEHDAVIASGERRKSSNGNMAPPPLH